MKRRGFFLFLITMISLVAASLWARDVTVFEVRQAVAMSDKQPKYRDYFLNGGLGQGLRRGMVVTVFRRQSVYDSYQNKSHGNLKVPIGKLKIIHSQKGLSVAREHSLFSRRSLPLLDYENIIVGDQVSTKSAYFPKKRSKSAAKVSQRAKSRSSGDKSSLSQTPKLSSVDTAGPL